MALQILARQRQRLFTQHVFASRPARPRTISRCGLIGRDDNDSIDFRIVQNVAVIHCSLFYAEFISCLMQKRFVEIAEHSKLGVRIVHNSLHMDLRHDAAGNDTNFEFLFHNSSLF